MLIRVVIYSIFVCLGGCLIVNHGDVDFHYIIPYTSQRSIQSRSIVRTHLLPGQTLPITVITPTPALPRNNSSRIPSGIFRGKPAFSGAPYPVNNTAITKTSHRSGYMPMHSSKIKDNLSCCSTSTYHKAPLATSSSHNQGTSVYGLPLIPTSSSNPMGSTARVSTTASFNTSMLASDAEFLDSHPALTTALACIIIYLNILFH